MTYKICELVEIDVEIAPEVRDQDSGELIAPAIYEKKFIQRDRDATPEEAAEFDARKAAAASIETRKPLMLAAVNAESDRRMGALLAGYPEHEIKTFDKQEAEARAYTADPNSHTPHIDALAAYRGIGVDVLAAKILIKADLFATYSGAIIGHRQGLEDAIDAAETVLDLEAIDVTAGWPE